MNSTFIKAPKTTITAPDPHKHVRYTLGMLLGVDDFVQEHAYLSGHSQWLVRELLGYGTVAGLEVSTDVDGEKGPRVLVSSGVAVDTRGQLVRVPHEQYAYLNTWLAASKEQINVQPEGTLTAYVVLSYTASAVDDVPIAGDPNRSPDTLMAPSRLEDDFILELSLNAPEQREERALRSFLSWLKHISLVDAEEEKVTSLAQFREAVRKAASQEGENGLPFAHDSSQSRLTVPVRRANEYWQAAFQLWVTELRPLWQAKSSRWDVPDDEPVLLAALRMKIATDKDDNWQVVIPEKASPVTIHEDERPYLLSTRLLQAWLLSEPHELAETEIVVNEVEVDEPGIDEQETLLLSKIDLTSQIVAAGTVKCDGTSAQPVYNELRAHIQEDGLISLHFKGYEDKLSYVVQALPVWNNKIRACTVSFDRFQENSFLLRVFNARGDAMRMEELHQLELMIQVVQYNVPVSPAKKAKSAHRNRR